jgi:DNA-binding GntR family transcriptional regulator
MEYQRSDLMPASLTALLNVQPIEADTSLKGRIYDRLKRAITSINIYAENAELRLDERELSVRLATSRTPIREALARLEQEGLVHIVPRKGVYIVRKSKAEILDMIMVWAALEGMAARLAARNASDAEIAGLRQLFTTFKNGQVEARIDEYSDTNVQFHQAILALGKSPLLRDMADHLFVHMRSIRMRTIGESDRANRSIIDHLHIIEALEDRDADLAERLVREHTLKLAEHIRDNVHYLD